MNLVTAETLSALQWPIGVRGHAMMTRLVRDGASAYIRGAPSSVALAVSSGSVVPLTEEGQGALSPLRLRVYVNRGALADGPRAPLSADGVGELLADLAPHYPTAALIVSGVDPLFDLALDAALDEEGALTLPDRRVRRWMPTALKVLGAHRDQLNDAERRLMARADVRVAPITSTSPRTLHAMREMHAALWGSAIHSDVAPTPREPWFSAAIEDDALETVGVYRDGRLRAFAVFHDAPDDRLVLVTMGCSAESACGHRASLLRILASSLLSEARRRRASLVTDADAPGFDTLPGSIEGWTLARVYTRHLSPLRRLVWRLHARGAAPPEELPVLILDDTEEVERRAYPDPDDEPTTMMSSSRSHRRAMQLGPRH